MSDRKIQTGDRVEVLDVSGYFKTLQNLQKGDIGIVINISELHYRIWVPGTDHRLQESWEWGLYRQTWYITGNRIRLVD